MNRLWLPAIALTTGLVLGAGTATLTHGQQPPDQPPAAQQRPPMPQGKFPYIHSAERSLQHAETQLEKAAHHFGGHRVKALQLIKQAEAELKEALAYASAHPEEFKDAAGGAKK
jgi:hypothetical protein